MAKKNCNRLEGFHTRKLVPIVVQEKVSGIKSLGCLSKLSKCEQRHFDSVEILKDNASPLAAGVYGPLDMEWAKLAGRLANAYRK